MNKIAVITYNRPHRKTQDLVFQLKLKHQSVDLFTTEWEDRKQLKPLIKHRPDPYQQKHEKLVIGGSKTLELHFSIEDINCLKEYDYVLIGGAGILDDRVVEKLTIINSHPGYLPNVKGLDALKWAIYEGQPIGVTVHIINENPDEGFLISRKIIPVYFEDTFHSVAQRVYEAEIRMLVDAVTINNYRYLVQDLASLYDKHYPIVHKRMPHYKERIMLEKFELLRRNSKSMYDE